MPDPSLGLSSGSRLVLIPTIAYGGFSVLQMLPGVGTLMLGVGLPRSH